MQTSSTSALCDQGQDVEQRDPVPCDHYRQRFSLDSSRATRGGSEVPDSKINLLNEKGIFPGSDSMGVVKAVASRLKAVFGKERENKGVETE